jgi:natural product precursor
MKQLRRLLKLNEPNSPLKPKEMEYLKGGYGVACDCLSSCGGSGDAALLSNKMMGVMTDKNPDQFHNC